MNKEYAEKIISLKLFRLLIWLTQVKIIQGIKNELQTSTAMIAHHVIS